MRYAPWVELGITEELYRELFHGKSYTPDDVRKLVEASRFAVDGRKLEHSSPSCKDVPQSQWTVDGRESYCTRCILGAALEPFKEVK